LAEPIKIVVQGLLLDERQQLGDPAKVAGAAAAAAVGTPAGSHRQRIDPERVVIVGHCDADLVQVVGALRAPRRLARGLHRRQQDRHEHADDRDHDQQLDQRKSMSAIHGCPISRSGFKPVGDCPHFSVPVAFNVCLSLTLRSGSA
jgi:hypothetical protein